MTESPQTVNQLVKTAQEALALNQLQDAAAALQTAKNQVSNCQEIGLILDTFGALMVRRGDMVVGLQQHLMAARVVREAIADWNGLIDPIAVPPSPDAASDDAQSEARFLANAGALAQICDQPKIADAALARACALLDSGEQRQLLAEVAHNYGVFLLNVGQTKEAIPLLKRALKIDSELLAENPNSPTLLAAVHSDQLRLAAAHRRTQTQENHEEARQIALKALELSVNLGVSAKASALLELATLEFARGDLLEAMQKTRMAIDLLEASPEAQEVENRPMQLGRAYVDMATYARRLGRPKAAMSSLNRAIEQAKRSKNAALNAMVAREQAEIVALVNRINSDPDQSINESE